MKIDLEAARYYSGLGDIVMLAWLAEGCKWGPTPLSFHRTRNLDLFHLLNLRADPDPGGISLDPVFTTEVADRGARPRLDYIRRFLKIDAVPVRPPLQLADEDERWASQQALELGSPLVLLFPQAAWRPREWPANYWVDLAWKLKDRGVPAVILLEKRDPRFENTPKYMWGFPVAKVAALMKRAALVIGNDSFPVHLAGTVGAPTLALMGPTRASVFAHMPTVECVGSDRVDCTGCHFQPPFRAACDQGCLSLYSLTPGDVLALAESAVGRQGCISIPLAGDPPPADRHEPKPSAPASPITVGPAGDPPTPPADPAAARPAGPPTRLEQIKELRPFREFTAADLVDQLRHVNEDRWLYAAGGQRYLCSILGAIHEELAKDRPDLATLVLEAVWIGRRMNDHGRAQADLDWVAPLHR